MAFQDFLLSNINATLSDPNKSDIYRYLDYTGDLSQAKILVEQEIRRAIATHNPEIKLTSIVTTVVNGRLSYSVAVQSQATEFVYDGKYKYDGTNKYQGYKLI